MKPERYKVILQNKEKSLVVTENFLERKIFSPSYLQRVCSNKKENEECVLSTLETFLYNAVNFSDTMFLKWHLCP